MRVLVTGNRGYIGTVLTSLLQEAGHEVTGFDSGLFDGCSVGPLPEVPTIEKDIRQASLADLQGQDAVIHLAGLSNDPLGQLRPSITHEINYEASVQLAGLARDAGIKRFLYASSCSVYGASGSDWLVEGSPKGPVTAYADSKLLSEQAISALATPDFSPSYLRAGTAYGYSPMIRFDLVLNNLAAWSAATGKIHFKSDGSAWRPLVHVEDIARAYLAILDAPRHSVADEAFNVGTTGENYQVRDLGQILQEVFPGCQVEFSGEAEADTRCYRVNCDKIAKVLPSYRPAWTVRTGAEQLRALLMEGDFRVDEFEGAHYQRLAHLESMIAEGIIDSSLRRKARLVRESRKQTSINASPA